MIERQTEWPASSGAPEWVASHVLRDTLSPASLPGGARSDRPGGGLLGLLSVGSVGRGSLARAAGAGVGAVGVHGAIFLLALTAGGVHQSAAREAEQVIEVELPMWEATSRQLEPVQPPVEQTAPVPPVVEPVEPAASPNTAAHPAAFPPAQDDHTSSTPTAEPPPAAAEAGAVLSAADEMLDFADAIQSGSAARFAGGVTSLRGTSKIAVRSPQATPAGMVGGTGSGHPAHATRTNRSRPPRLAGGTLWDCPFPSEAELESIDEAAVSLQIQVAPDGRVRHVNVVRDPGYGFGREARRCATRKHFEPGLDEGGNPVVATTHVNVRFQR